MELRKLAILLLSDHSHGISDEAWYQLKMMLRKEGHAHVDIIYMVRHCDGRNYLPFNHDLT